MTMRDAIISRREKMLQPHFGAKCENATHTLKSEKMESSGLSKI